MPNKVVIIQGSSRPLGDTYTQVQALKQFGQYDHIDLCQYAIGQFDYDFNNKADDFLPLIKKLITDYDVWVMASPVYWYSMSGIMKTFMDRISDLLYKHKALGRQLRGKKMACLSITNEKEIVDSFYEAFRLSAGYLGMKYLGECHAWDASPSQATEVTNNLKALAKILNKY